jgi:hypothetical protein
MPKHMTPQKKEAIYSALLESLAPGTNSQAVLDLQWISLEGGGALSLDQVQERINLMREQDVPALNGLTTFLKTRFDQDAFDPPHNQTFPAPSAQDVSHYAFEIDRSLPILYAEIDRSFVNHCSAEQLIAIAGLVTGVTGLVDGRQSVLVESSSEFLDLDVENATKEKKVKREDVQAVLNTLITSNVPLFEDDTTEFSAEFKAEVKRRLKELRSQSLAREGRLEEPESSAQNPLPAPEEKPKEYEKSLPVTLSLSAYTFLGTVFFPIGPVAVCACALAVLLSVLSLRKGASYAAWSGDTLTLLCRPVAAINLLAFFVLTVFAPSFVDVSGPLSVMSDFLAGLNPLFLAGMGLCIYSLLALFSVVSASEITPKEGVKGAALLAVHILMTLAALGGAIFLFVTASPVLSVFELVPLMCTLLFSVVSVGVIARKISALPRRAADGYAQLVGSPARSFHLIGRPNSELRLVPPFPFPAVATKGYLEEHLEKNLSSLVMEFLQDSPFCLEGGNITQIAKALEERGLEHRPDTNRLYCKPAWSLKEDARGGGFGTFFVDMERTTLYFKHGEEVESGEVAMRAEPGVLSQEAAEIQKLIGELGSFASDEDSEKCKKKKDEIVQKYIDLFSGQRDFKTSQAQKNNFEKFMLRYCQQVETLAGSQIFSILLQYPGVIDLVSYHLSKEESAKLLRVFTSENAVDISDKFRSSACCHLHLTDKGISMKLIRSYRIGEWLETMLNLVPLFAGKGVVPVGEYTSTKMLQIETVLTLSDSDEQIEVTSVRFKGGSPLLNDLLKGLITGSPEKEILAIFRQALAIEEAPAVEEKFALSPFST